MSTLHVFLFFVPLYCNVELFLLLGGEMRTVPRPVTFFATVVAVTLSHIVRSRRASSTCCFCALAFGSCVASIGSASFTSACTPSFLTATASPALSALLKEC